MSYKERLSDIDRGSPESVTSQIVDAFSDAIDRRARRARSSPPTRELAELAGVNHRPPRGLPAARGHGARHRPGGEGDVRALGRRAPAHLRAEGRRRPRGSSTPSPRRLETHGDRVLTDMMRRRSRVRRAAAVMVGHPARTCCPSSGSADHSRRRRWPRRPPGAPVHRPRGVRVAARGAREPRATGVAERRPTEEIVVTTGRGTGA